MEEICLHALNKRRESFKEEWEKSSQQSLQQISVVLACSSFLDLLPGLPDEVVLNHIWPRIRKDFEHVHDLPLAALRNLMRNICKLAGTSKKWRAVVTHSASWAAIRMLMQGGHLLGSGDLKAKYFRHQLRHLPPIDAYSTEDLMKLGPVIMQWEDFTIEEIRVYLEVCPKDHHDPEDVFGRVESWICQRSNMPPRYNWILDN